MSEPMRFVAFPSHSGVQEDSGVHRARTRALAEARRACEAEEMWDEDVAIAKFEWDMSIQEGTSPPAVADTAPFALVTRLGPQVDGAVAGEGEAAASSRAALARTVGHGLLGGLLLALVLIVCTPPGRASLASWATLGHTDDVRRVLHHR